MSFVKLVSCHMIAFLAGFIIDQFLGDPYCLPHPIRLIGNLIGFLEKKWNTTDSAKARRKGSLMVLCVAGATAFTAFCLLFLGYRIHPTLGILLESIMTYQILAVKCLKVESMKVYRALSKGDTEGARYAVSMIVGRDTKVLDETGIAKAAIETVAENTSDGIIAPMIYTALGGPVLGFTYKAINTMDSMVGYKNDRYLYFGRTAARLDDVVNYLPSRFSALLMIAACTFLGKDFDYKRAFRIWKRDRRKHASPNSAQTESTCAGALGIQLAGDAWYFGVLHKKEFLGDPLRAVEYEDIRRANRLLYGTAYLCEGMCLAIMLVIYLLV